MLHQLTRPAMALLLLMCAGFMANAQSEKEKRAYKEMADEARRAVWQWDLPAFANRKVPAEYNKYSTVVLARHTEIQAAAKTKFHFYLVTAAVTKEVSFIRTVREMVKINDKASLDKYSSISYTQFERRSGIFSADKTSTIVGVRVIKPDGSVQDVDADETILTKDEKNNREAKLAIPNLQVGDIIDYFVQVLEKAEEGASYKEFLFNMAGESPVMSYSVHGLVNRKYALEHRALNGAPELKITENGDDFELNLSKKDIPAYPVDLWVSPMRQFPIVRLNVVLGSRGMAARAVNARKPGEIIKNIPQSEIIEDIKVTAAFKRMEAKQGAYKLIAAQIKSLLKSYNKRNEDLPKDSLPVYIFYAFRWLSFYSTDAKTDIVVGPERNYLSINNNRDYMLNLNEVMNEFDIDCDLVLVTSKYGPQNNQVLTRRDYDILLRTKDPRPMYFYMDGVFSNAGFIPYQYEQQKAPSLFLVKLRGSLVNSRADEGFADIPATPFSANKKREEINVAFKPGDMMQLLVNRQVMQTGQMKLDDQRRLLLFEDYYEKERQAMGVKQTLVESFEERRKTRSLSGEYTEAFTRARKDWKDQFSGEIQSNFDAAPQELDNYKVTEMGLRHSQPDFTYGADFIMDGWVKKAGNNFILDIGRFMGSQLKPEESQRTRTIDVYMPYARSFEWQVSVKLPEGYSVEGLDKLNKLVDNECGSFSAAATLQNNTLQVKLVKIYKHNFEPAANWSKLLNIIDAAQEFTTAKVLLKKKS